MKLITGACPASAALLICWKKPSPKKALGWKGLPLAYAETIEE